MNREILEEKALLYALGTLPRSEVEEFEALIKSDYELQDLVHQGQRLNELDAFECERAEPPFRVYPKLMARIDQEEERAGVAAPAAAPQLRSLPSANEGASGSQPKRRLSPVFAWSGWGLAACAALVIGLQFSRPEKAAASGAATGDIVVNNLANPRLVAVQPPSEDFGLEDRMLELAGLAEAYWFAREGIPEGQLLAAKEGADVEALSGGFTIFDRKYQIGFIAVENMPRESEGKSYHVWAKTDGDSKVVRAGALPIGDESRGLFFFDLSSLASEVESLDRVNFFVTEESTPEPQQPNRNMIVLSDL